MVNASLSLPDVNVPAAPDIGLPDELRVVTFMALYFVFLFTFVHTAYYAMATYELF